ncbi:hypothetical protein E4U43_002130 [Claviceps pusilla]|uniref:FAD-binding domain-containing protein n=1 Tax=Claviceps pusilla TaxID=123648 RepID=A0A9P7N6M7_9HYPO|nr:hypothetical protein E4U43_002130 [Claviceps pusilla]
MFCSVLHSSHSTSTCQASNGRPSRRAECCVRIGFENGEVLDAEYLLGADDCSSKIRQLLLGFDTAQPCPSGYLFATGITEYADATRTDAITKAYHVASIMMGTESVGGVGRAYLVMSTNDPRDKSAWTTFWKKLWRGEPLDLSGRDALQYIESNTPPLLDVFQSAVEWTARDSSVYIDEMKYWIPMPWDNLGGRVTLAGDAAHPMLIYRGQNFQHSITDVDNYVETLSRLEMTGDGDAARAKALMNYDAEMIGRGSKAVQQFLEEAEKALDPDRIKDMLMMTKGHIKGA